MSGETDLAALAARIETLERQSQRLKHLCAIMAVAFVGIAAAQAVATKATAMIAQRCFSRRL